MRSWGQSCTSLDGIDRVPRVPSSTVLSCVLCKYLARAGGVSQASLSGPAREPHNRRSHKCKRTTLLFRTWDSVDQGPWDITEQWRLSFSLGSLAEHRSSHLVGPQEMCVE